MPHGQRKNGRFVVPAALCIQRPNQTDNSTINNCTSQPSCLAASLIFNSTFNMVIFHAWQMLTGQLSAGYSANYVLRVTTHSAGPSPCPLTAILGICSKRLGHQMLIDQISMGFHSPFSSYPLRANSERAIRIKSSVPGPYVTIDTFDKRSEACGPYVYAFQSASEAAALFN
jgi:hypothetical protein